MLTLAVLGLSTACASVDTAKMNGKDVVTATRVAPVIFGAMGAPTSKCLADLNTAGVKSVETVLGSNEEMPFISRLSNVEMCQATGSK